MSIGTGSTQNVVLPAGWSISPGRETSQLNAQGQVVQGIVWPLTSPKGTVTSVFVPYAMIANVAVVQDYFNTRIAAIEAIGG